MFLNNLFDCVCKCNWFCSTLIFYFESYLVWNGINSFKIKHIKEQFVSSSCNKVILNYNAQCMIALFRKNREEGTYTMLGNGVVGILSESGNKWERRAPLTPSHCARLLHGGKDKTGVARIIVQPSTKRIHLDAMYEDVGCEISDDLSECGLIVGIKQPKVMRSYVLWF